MKIIPVAFDSMGARSMATIVETKDARIFIDPSVALGPRRYGLPPHPMEFEKMDQFWSRTESLSETADAFVITHYHYDHHNPERAHIFKNRTVFIKDPENSINFSQKKRARLFTSLIKDTSEIVIADSNTIEIGNTLMEFSPPVPHGTDSKLGYVVMVYIEEKGSFLFTSDVEGATLKEQIEWISGRNPETIFVDGPMTYMLGYRYSMRSYERSIENLTEIMGGDLKHMVLDHHLTRDINWRDKMKKVFNAGEEHGVQVSSAAQFAGEEENLLEAMRDRLYREHSHIGR